MLIAYVSLDLHANYNARISATISRFSKRFKDGYKLSSRI